ncbi:MAG: AAA family ATPase, partial [Nitrososphaerota archaeon]|nr:AAA family ATPase [Nitrososphaerota archaeon]
MFSFFQTERKKVLLIDLENPPSLLKERISFLQKNGDVGEIFFLSGALYLDNPKHVKMLEQILTEKGIGVVFLDNLSACFQKIMNENESLRLYRILKTLKNIAVKNGVTFVLVHHLRKPGQFISANPLDEVRGSSVIVGIVDMVYVLQRIQDFYQLQIVKNRVSTFNETLLLELQRGGFQLLQKGVETPNRLSEVIKFIEVTANNTPNGIFSIGTLRESSYF